MKKRCGILLAILLIAILVVSLTGNVFAAGPQVAANATEQEPVIYEPMMGHNCHEKHQPTDNQDEPAIHEPAITGNNRPRTVAVSPEMTAPRTQAVSPMEDVNSVVYSDAGFTNV